MKQNRGTPSRSWRGPRTTLGGILVLVALAGCPAPTAVDTGPDANVLFLVQAQPGGPVMDALYTGRVAIDQRGCLVLDGSPGRETLVWPFGFQLRRDKVSLSVHDRDGKEVLGVGDLTRFGGGFVSELPQGLLAPAMARAAVERCPGGYWVVGETFP